MDEYIKNFIMNIEPKDIQVHENLAIIPLCLNGDGGPSYITLKEALDKGTFTVREVSEGGAVPELKVVNKGDDMVLLLDGEELAGAKQNRVLNTTVLIPPNSEVIIPVSCTERGRWSYVSHEFRDSDLILAYNIKRKKAGLVTQNICATGRYESNQGEIWNDIESMSNNAGVYSRTSAMKDIFESKEKDLDDYIKSISIIPDQKGMMVMINGMFLGFDIISSSNAYRVLHPKLLKSVAIEALLERNKKRIVPLDAVAKGFLRDILTCNYTKHKSVGLGYDVRFEGSKKVGSALVHEDNVIHMAFFTISESDKIDNMYGYRRRRGFRRV